MSKGSLNLTATTNSKAMRVTVKASPMVKRLLTERQMVAIASNPKMQAFLKRAMAKEMARIRAKCKALTVSLPTTST